MNSPTIIRRPVATYIGLAIALLAAPIFMAVFRLVAGENRSDLQVLARELGIWLLVGVLLWIVRRREMLPLTSIGLHTDRPLRSILRGVVLAVVVLAVTIGVYLALKQMGIHLGIAAGVLGAVFTVFYVKFRDLLAFIGVQIKANTIALQRSEHNATMAQWTVIRMAIVENRDLAQMMSAGLRGELVMDAADQLRLEQFLQENAWAAFHIWDRTQRGIFPKGTFEQTGGALLCGLLRTARGGQWWTGAKTSTYIPAFVADVDAMMARDT